MDNNMNSKLFKTYADIERINDDINNSMIDFLAKASDLVELSEDDYQIEMTLQLNKISLKGYVLDSDICFQLKNFNIIDYSLEELKEYIVQYEKDNSVDCSKYLLALSLYEQLEKIERLVDSKNDVELQWLNNIITDISSIKNINKDEHEKLYYSCKNQLDSFLKNARIDEQAYNLCILVMNDIFNYYISGYPNIPDEYIYKI